ncbi:unnamed protein product [Schistosoma bovis]|nr:unnamed protein product [Schistosoma bovis]CAH8580191.1 unnamed protein product [Schistosoma bovis]
MPHLKVLCLHGYRQNSDVFREKTGGLRKSLKKFCEFKFISAPNVIECSSNACAWWFSKPLEFLAQESSTYDAGFRESILAVKKYIKEEGPFDGMLGFSQGAAFLLLLQIMMEHKLSETLQNISNLTLSTSSSDCQTIVISHFSYYSLLSISLL